MEGLPNFENREAEIDQMIEDFAKQEGMTAEDILCDIIVFAPYDGNDASNPDYIEEVAERLGISVEEMTKYAIKKAKEQMEESEN